MIKLILLLAGLSLFIVHHFGGQVSGNIQLISLMAGVVLLGIPHGAADLLVATKNEVEKNKHFSKRSFHINYMSRMVLFGLLLWVLPMVGIVLFILFAAYHFGETDINKYKENSLLGKIYVTSYGIVILAVMLLSHARQLLPMSGIFHSLDNQELLINSIERYRLFIFLAIILTFLILTGFYFHYIQATIKSGVLMIGQLFILLFILYNLPPLLGFVFYFVGWHSVLSLKYIVEYLSKDGLTTGKRIAHQIIFYSLLAIGGMIVFAAAGLFFFHKSAPTFYIFLGLAVLTAPHMHIMQDMYNNINCKRKLQLNSLINPYLS